MERISPDVTLSVNESTGKVEAAYIRLRPGVAHETREADESGNAFADYDEGGVLLGIELLAPCSVRVLDKIAEGQPEPFRHPSRYAPHDLVCS